jgi:hypothetical protein
MAFAPRSGFGEGFGQEKPLFCQHISISIVFCNLVLANCIEVAASLFLCAAVPHVVLLPFASRCMQITMDQKRAEGLSCEELSWAENS